MKAYFKILTLSLLAVTLFLPPAFSQKIAITDVHVIPMDREILLENQTVLISNGKIESISNSADFQNNGNYQIIEGKGKYLIPGLSEFHSHIPNNMELAEETMWLYVMHGVLTVRGMIGHPNHLVLKEKIANGELVGPRIFAAGPSLNGTSVENPEKGRQMVKDQAAANYDHLKLHPGLDKPKFDAIAKTAQNEDIFYGGHVSVDVGLVHALAGGYRSIEHMDGYIEALVSDKSLLDPQVSGLFGVNLIEHIDRNKMDELVKMTKAQKTWIVPTQSLFERWMGPASAQEFEQMEEFKLMAVGTRANWFRQKRMFDNSQPNKEKLEDYLAFRREMLMKLHNAGVPFVLGSDSPQILNVPGVATHHEMAALARAGMSPFEIYKTGTVNAAEYFEQKETFGQITVGADADLVLLNANPLEAVENFQTIEGVIVQGKFITKETLNQKKMEIIEANKE
ncbi:amidohydrolase family protein [Peijinzhouia sedimentorum]